MDNPSDGASPKAQCELWFKQIVGTLVGSIRRLNLGSAAGLLGWQGTEAASGIRRLARPGLPLVPLNLETKEVVGRQGGYLLLLAEAMERNLGSPYWGTARQLAGKQLDLRPGEEANGVLVWWRYPRGDDEDSDLDKENGEERKLGFFVDRAEYWNVDQAVVRVGKVTHRKHRPDATNLDYRSVEGLLRVHGVQVVEPHSDKNSHSPKLLVAKDRIVLPVTRLSRARFQNPLARQHAILYLMAHWALYKGGKKSPADDAKARALEDLACHLAALYLSCALGIEFYKPDDLSNWFAASLRGPLEEEVTYLLDASKLASGIYFKLYDPVRVLKPKDPKRIEAGRKAAMTKKKARRASRSKDPRRVAAAKKAWETMRSSDWKPPGKRGQAQET